MLSHELQTPLTAIIACTGLLTEELQKEENNTLLRLGNNIAKSASSLQTRLDELLNLSRGKDSAFRIKKTVIDFSEFTKEIVEQMTPLFRNNKQSISLEVPDTLIITADKQRLEQILFNLLSNAIKFTPSGGNIYLRAKINKKNLIVEIEDTGPGIPPEEQEKLFLPYHRIRSDRMQYSGLGLGLSITKQLVELHGGQIWVESKKNRGSVFIFTLPLNEK